MKRKFASPPIGHSMFLLAALTLLMGHSALAQNLLKNGDFEQPLGPTNWMIGTLHGTKDNFDVKGRTRFGANGGLFGGTFRPVTAAKPCHAYFGQTVSNLTASQTYNVSGAMREEWWRDRDPETGLYNPGGDGRRDKFLVYIEAIGSLGTPMADGRSSVLATNQTPPSGPPAGFPDCLVYANINWATYATKQKPDTNGNIEIRLHFHKLTGVIYDKCWMMPAVFDNISLTP